MFGVRLRGSGATAEAGLLNSKLICSGAVEKSRFYSSGSSGGTVTTKTAYVNNPRSTQILHLRETPSQSARSIGQYYNGTQVKVVSYGATWCEVYVGTKHGYMMTRYLSFDGNYVRPSTTATPY